MYEKGRATRGHILKIFAPYLITAYLWFHISEFVSQRKCLTPKNICEALKGPQRQFLKEALFVQYDNNKNEIILSTPTSIKYIPEGTKILRSLIATSIKEGDCLNAWKFVARHCENGSSHIQIFYFDHS